ncbi:SDR family oxidoreductase [Puia sp. P3]|uniref:SDR family oxidoreductase n=1 Tax=Puia sp. P3 TaxID=3423952 RepID=UPI003D67DC4B
MRSLWPSAGRRCSEKWIRTLPDPAGKLREIEGKIPLGSRMTTAEEIANMTVFLLSEVSSHTTGQLIHVDGGMCIWTGRWRMRRGVWVLWSRRSCELRRRCSAYLLMK